MILYNRDIIRTEVGPKTRLPTRAKKQQGPKVTHFYFIDDLKVVESNEKDLQETNRIVTGISQDTGMTFEVSKCAEVVYKREKITKGEGLKIENNKAECLYPEDYEYYKFLGVEEDDGQLDEKAKERVIEECFKRIELKLKLKFKFICITNNNNAGTSLCINSLPSKCKNVFSKSFLK